MTSCLRAGMLFWVILGLGCGGRMPEGLGATEGRFAPCPKKPNCVSSYANEEEHRIASFEIEGSTEKAWAGLQSFLENSSRAEIVTSEAGYIHAVYTSSLMRYRDDVEFLLQRDQGDIAVRSASRVGYSDMGVNRDRIEAIRGALSEQGLVKRPKHD